MSDKIDKIQWLFITGYLMANVFTCQSAPALKRTLSIGEARSEIGVVAAYQRFPADYRIDRLGSLQSGDEYYPIFISYLAKQRKWRTLVFANSGSYLGYYETADRPAELYADELIYPGPSYSVESGDDAEGEFDSGDTHIIRFGASGPPDEVKFEHKIYSFVSSPIRVRPESPGYRFVQAADRIVDAMNRSRYKRVRDDFSVDALKRISEEQTVEILSGVRKKLGRIERVGVPWVQSPNTAVLPLTFEQAIGGLKLMLTEENKVAGMWVLPFKTAFPEIGNNKTTMTLPFNGQWRVMWGGEHRDQTKYFGSRIGHYSLVFYRSSRFGKTFRDRGRRNKDYMAFGQPIRAPAAGTVVAVIKGIEDNRPHSPNPFDRLGNAVMIQHATNEFSVLGHLMLDSIRVQVGDVVESRQLIAQCGNSGDSSQPSLYFHLQNSSSILAGSGYRVVFTNLYLKSHGETEVVETHLPVRGEFLQQRLLPQKVETAGQGVNAKTTGQ